MGSWGRPIACVRKQLDELTTLLGLGIVYEFQLAGAD